MTGVPYLPLASRDAVLDWDRVVAIKRHQPNQFSSFFTWVILDTGVTLEVDLTFESASMLFNEAQAARRNRGGK